MARYLDANTEYHQYTTDADLLLSIRIWRTGLGCMEQDLPPCILKTLVEVLYLLEQFLALFDQAVGLTGVDGLVVEGRAFQ